MQPKDEFTTNNPTAILTDLVLSINNSHTDSSYNMGRAGGGSSSNNSTTNTISSSLTENTVKAVTTNSNSRSTCNSTNANNSNNNSINNQGNHINSPSKMIALKNMNNLINISSSNSNQLSDWNNIDDTGAGWGDGEFETLNESSAGMILRCNNAPKIPPNSYAPLSVKPKSLTFD